jgi:LmbE family N-acetylglucosaminyl deacetylase
VVLRPIAEEIGAEMILVTGESSDSHIAGMAKRASEDGRPAVVFYFSDFDPSGHQMPISVARELQALCDLYYVGLDIKLYPVALTLEQIRALGLPSSPLKETERRASRWRETHGHDQTEIDAMVELHPDALREAVFAVILPFYDADLDSRVLAAEVRWRKKADEALEVHPDYKRASQRIKAAWKSARAAASKLHREQRQSAHILQDSIPPPPEVPEAELDGEAKPALFDSETDFVTATRHLIRHKKLIGSSDDDDQ